MNKDKFVEYVISEWKKKGKINNEEDTKEIIKMIFFLLSNYRLKCLLGTIIDIDDLAEKYYKVKNE